MTGPRLVGQRILVPGRMFYGNAPLEGRGWSKILVTPSVQVFRKLPLRRQREFMRSGEGMTVRTHLDKVYGELELSLGWGVLLFGGPYITRTRLKSLEPACGGCCCCSCCC